MKKTIQSLLSRVENREAFAAGFTSIRGGLRSLLVESNPSECSNTFVCQGTNYGKCSNTGDCSHSTNSGTGCTNSGPVCYSY